MSSTDFMSQVFPITYKVCIKSPCTVSTALLALIEVHGLLIQTLTIRINFKHTYNIITGRWLDGIVHGIQYPVIHRDHLLDYLQDGEECPQLISGT